MKKILVPFDFSDAAVSALRTAIGFADALRSEIHVLHVIELPVIHDSVLMPVLNFEETLLDELKQRAQKSLERISAEVEGHPRLQHRISFGPISRVILTSVQEMKIDLVIMGTKGASGIQEVFVGSNTEKIVRASTVPVLVVRKVLRLDRIKQIVFPTNVDFEPMEELILHLKALQNFFGAKLHLVWINTPGNFSNDEKSLSRLNGFATRHMLNNFSVNVFNDTYEESGIIRFCHHIHADLLIMATHGRRGLAHVFAGSLTEDVVNHIDLPVWTYSVRVKESGVLK
jgi:nucleotide-binding universal stress UspA family protein